MGAWTMNEKNMIFAVTNRALPVTGSVRTVVQLDNPSSLISPSPSHEVKLRNKTPSSGMMANSRKKARAGAASHPDGPRSRARREEPDVVDTGLLSDRRVHRGDELLRGDLLQEDLVEVGQHGIPLRRAERLVPGKGEARSVLGHAIHVGQEVLVRRCGELAFDALDHGNRSGVDKALDVAVREHPVLDEFERGLLLALCGLGGDGPEVGGVADHVGRVALAAGDRGEGRIAQLAALDEV